MSYPITHVIPEAVMLNTQQAMADRFAGYGGDPEGKNFVWGAAYVETVKFYKSLASLKCPYRVTPWTLTPEGAVETVMFFESKADTRHFQAWQQNPAVDGVRA